MPLDHELASSFGRKLLPKLFSEEATNIFLSLETWGYLLSYIVGASMNISPFGCRISLMWPSM